MCDFDKFNAEFAEALRNAKEENKYFALLCVHASSAFKSSEELLTGKMLCTRFFTFSGLFGSLAFAVHWLLQSTLLLGVGLVIGRLLKNRGSAVQSAVYRTTLVAMLLCPLATWGLSQAGLSGWSLTDVEEPSKTTVAEFAEPIATSSLPTPSAEDLQVSDDPLQGAKALNVKSVSTPIVRQPVSRFVIVIVAASLISTALLLRLALAWWRLARLRRQAVSADAETLALCRELAETLGVPVPAVFCSPYVPSPCLAGIRRPAVLLPEEKGQVSMRDVLVHELAHLRRHDCHWNLLRRAATALFWFQPLLWKLSSRLEATAEEVCDDFVVQYGANRQEYAHRLVDIAELSLAPIAAAGVGMVSLRSMLAQRVARILDTSRKLSTQINNRLLAVVLAGGLVGTLVVGLVGVGSQALQAETESVVGGSEEVTRIELQPKLKVSGTVTDDAGQPIAGALVRTKFMNDIREASTDGKGEYVLLGCEPRMARVVVSAKGKATDMQEVRVDAEMAPVNFSMKPGGKIRIRVVDEKGKGIPKARIFLQRWRGMIRYFEFDHVSQYADENGVWEWEEAPLDEFQADICRPGGMQLSSQFLIAREEEYVFKPPRALVVSGSVLDAKTKQPIQSFRVISGLRNSAPRSGVNWIPGNSYEGSDGKYRIRLKYGYPAHLVRIEANGYQVAISRDFMTDEGDVEYDFELQQAEDISATILTASGEPAAHAKMALGVSGSQIMIKAGRIDERSAYATKLDADTNGQFSIPSRDEPFQLVIIHTAGFAHIKSSDGPIPSRITLTPWARVEGTFRVGAEPAPNVVLSLFSGGINSYGDDVPHISTHHEVTTDKDGRYVFERLFPGQGSISRRILLIGDDGATEVTSSQRISAEFIAGKTTHLDLGGTGRPVIGKLVPPAEYAKKVFWNFANVSVQVDLKAPGPPKPPADVQIEPGKYNAWFKEWITTDEGKAWFSTYQADMKAYRKLRPKTPYMMASVDRDGSFRIDDAPSGEFVFRVSFSRHAPGGISNYKFSIPEIEGLRSDQPFDLGTLELDPLDP